MKNKHKTLEYPSGARLLYAGRYAGTHDVGWHVHDAPELILVTAGHCRMSAGRDLWFDGRPGTLYVLPRGLAQYHRSDAFTQDIYLVYHAPEHLFNSSTPRTLEIPLDGLAARLFDAIGTLYLSPAAGDAAPVLNALLLALLEELNRQERRQSLHCARHPSLQRAVEFLEANLNRNLTMAEVARRAAMSPSQLTVLFRREFGRAPLKQHMKWRLHLAARLLGGRVQGVKEAAAATGFADTNYFIRRFRQQFGKPPAAWLKTEDGIPPQARPGTADGHSQFLE